MGQKNVERPQGLEASRPAPKQTDLNAGANWDPQPNAGQFAKKAPLVPKPSVSDSPDGVMSFKSASSDPKDAPLPLGRSYSEFPASTANETRPRGRFQDKVDVRSIEKGDASTATDTGKAHS